MTTATAPTAHDTYSDWNGTRFALLVTTPYPSPYRPTYRVTGHNVGTCPAVKGDILARDASLNEVAEANEHWDGEVEYMTPWPCGMCVTVNTGRAARVAYEAPRPEFGAGAGVPAARPAVEADPREAEARAYAAAYTGSFAFMVDMRAKALRPAARFTPNMVTAILRCKAADATRAAAPAATVASPAPQADENSRRAALAANAFAGACRACNGQVAAGAGRREKVEGRWTVLHSTTGECSTPAAPAVEAPTTTTTPDVPAGHYAVETEEGHLAFYNVDRPTEGRWAGRTFVSVQASDEYHAIRGRDAANAILAKIAVDPRAAMLRYGTEIGRCGHCNRTLTDETSRALGIGPVCRAGMGF